mgnify:CR=1 FL=1
MSLQSIDPTTTEAWQKLTQHYKDTQGEKIKALFSSDGDRAKNFTLKWNDFLVDFSKSNPQVIGARQTGGGFGGCTLNLVHETAVDVFIADATIAYKSEFNIALEAFEVLPSGGTHASATSKNVS